MPKANYLQMDIRTRIAELIRYSPDLASYDLEFRPPSYWQPTPSVDPLDSLDLDARRALERRHPRFMSGGYLPPLEDWTEIVRLTMKSTTGDAISFRARSEEHTSELQSQFHLV